MLSHKNINSLLANNNNRFLNLSNTRFTSLDGESKITEEEIKALMSEYPPLNYGVNVILLNSVEYENKAIYYGEWNKETKEKHGRGI